jgi:hypothetical protein
VLSHISANVSGLVTVQMLVAVMFSLAGAPWLLEAVATSVALDISAAPDPPAAELPLPIQNRLLSADGAAAALPAEALTAPTLLSRLLRASLHTPLAAEWQPISDRLLQLLLPHPAIAKESAQDDDAQKSAKPPVSAAAASELTAREADVCECVGALQALRSLAADGLPDLMAQQILQAAPMFKAPLPFSLAAGTADWADGPALCNPADPAFQKLITSHVAASQMRSALDLVTCALRTDAPAVEAPAHVAATHDSNAPAAANGVSVATIAAVHGVDGMLVLARAVGAAVVWVNGARAAMQHAQLVGEPRSLQAQAAETARAEAFLHSACRALCACADGLLGLHKARSEEQAGPCMHARWGIVCHALLAAYHVATWTPANLAVRSCSTAQC